MDDAFVSQREGEKRVMKTKLSHILILCLVLAMLAALPVSAQGGAGVITFQGQLADGNGGFLTGAYNLHFTIYDAESGGTALWGPETHNSVPVSQGLFMVQLGSIEVLDGAIFDGAARWLEMAVWNGAAWETLSPRLLMGGAVYAFQAGGLPPDTTLTGTGQVVLSVVNTAGKIGVKGVSEGATSGASRGVYGTSNSTYGKGVYGEATAASGATYGVFGKSASTQGTGVFGKATATSGATYGGYFVSDSSSGIGVQGEASAISNQITFGVAGTNYGSVGGGVRGWARALNGTTIGVFGQSDSTDGRGVLGAASATSGETYGVVGTSASSSGIGVYGEATSSGVGVVAKSEKGNVFEGYGSSGLVFKVDNSGNVFADGTYQSPAADFAEMLPGDEGLEPGDVLAIAADGRVTKASAENPLAIIGVYSTAPAFLGGRSSADSEQSPARVPVAILGVVPVKVSAENGPIRPNDPLTAGRSPGYAARAIPLFVLDGGEGVYAGGSILGRALEGLDSGEGVIQVLLQLR